MIFGGLAIMVTCVTVDPLALRPRLSPGLPFSDVFFNLIVYWFSLNTPYTFVIYAVEIARRRVIKRLIIGNQFIENRSPDSDHLSCIYPVCVPDLWIERQ